MIISVSFLYDGIEIEAEGFMVNDHVLDLELYGTISEYVDSPTLDIVKEMAKELILEQYNNPEMSF